MSISPRKHGFHLPEGLVAPYDFHDQGWNRRGDMRWNEKFQFFAHRCVQVGEKRYYIKNAKGGGWEDVSGRSAALTRLYQEHCGTVTIGGVQQLLTMDDCKAFLSAGVVQFRHVTYVPGAPDFVWFNGERRLNLYRDTRIDGDEDDIPVCTPLLKVLRNSLCGETDELDLSEMVEEIMSDRPTPFRWMMHWLAVGYQMPGLTTQTNLWFMGGRGTGKGSLISVLRQIHGARAVGKVDASDIGKGWSTSLFGCSILEWDEFKQQGFHDVNRFIKEKTGNSTLSITTRNVGDILQPNVTLHIFSTNEKLPMFVEKDDRQNTFIATTRDEAWKARAKALWTDKNEIYDPRVPSGFAALLNAIEIDMRFVRSPLKTDLRGALTAHFADDSIEQWLEHVTQNTVGYEFPTWGQLHAGYKDFVNRHLSVRPMDLKAFKAAMVEDGHAKETVGKDRHRRSFRYVRVFKLDADNVVSLHGDDQ